MVYPSGPALPEEYAPLPRAEFAFPGPLRDRLVGAILAGAKTATTSLLREYGPGGGGDDGPMPEGGEPMPEPGARSLLVDSADVPVAVIETTEVRVVPLAQVDAAHARDEGEGHATVAAWRAAHEGFWNGEEMRAALGDAGFTVDDSTPVVLERFRVVADLRRPDPDPDSDPDPAPDSRRPR